MNAQLKPRYTSLRIRYYEYGDMDNFKEREGDYFNFDPQHQATNDTYSLVNEKDEVVAVMGFILFHEGVGAVWAVISDDARGHGIAVTRYAKTLLKRWINDYGLFRVQALVRVDRPEYKRWIKLLGFDYESTMRKVTPDRRDMECYALVR